MSFTSNNHTFLTKVLGIAFGAVALFTFAFFLNASFAAPQAEAVCDPSFDDCGPKLKACSDGQDNDGDELTDYPDDLGCSGSNDNDETNTMCADGLDNDNDGKTDYKADGTGDPGCTSTTDIGELGTAQCDDGLDNDSDTKIDYRSNGSGDAGCSSLTDTTELQPNRTLTISIPAQGESFDNYAKGQVTVSGQSTCVSGVCSYSIADGQTVSLTAQPLVNDAGNASFFTGWVDGDCLGSAAGTSVVMSSDKSCTAKFHVHGAPYPTTHTITFNNPGNGSGTATFRQAGILKTCTLNAGGSCSYTTQDDESISSISANPNAGVTTSYPNSRESCFQDGGVFVQTNRICTVNFTLSSAPTSAPTCSSVTPNPALVGQSITFNGSSTATGAWSWDAPASSGASPNRGSSQTFLTSYSTIGSKTVTVTKGGGVSGTCNVLVTDNVSSYVNVQSNLNTNISVTGLTSQTNRAFVANVLQSFESIPGSYSVTPSAIPGYTYKITQCNNAICSQTLSAGGDITFNVEYTVVDPPEYYCSASPSPTSVNTNTTFTATGMTGPYVWSFPGAYYMSGNVNTAQPSYTVQYPTDGTYNATVTAGGGGQTAQCSVVVGTGTPPPPTTGLALDFYVTSPANGIIGSTVGPITIAYGTNINLEWVSSNVSPTGCVASGDWSGSKTRNIYASEAKGPLTTPSPKAYTLRCYGDGTYGQPEPYIEKSITVNVATTNKCTLNVTSNVATTWSFTGPTPPTPPAASSTSATYIVDPGTYTIVPATLGGGYTGPTVTPAASQVCAAGATQSYALVYTPPATTAVDIKANGSDNPAAIVKGDTASLTWSTDNVVAGSCVASNGWSGAKADDGSETTNALNANATFTITCTSSSTGASVADSVAVSVRDAQCEDGADNDGDGTIDGNDPGCGSGDDDDDDNEQNDNPQCSDGVDNDGDSDVDYPEDPECDSAADDLEVGDGDVIDACGDGFDNDGDGTIDGFDTGCDSGDGTEQSEPDIREI